MPDTPAPHPGRPRTRRARVDPARHAAVEALDPAALRALLRRQDRRCLVCHIGGENRLQPYEEHALVDRTGAVRGFVCGRCDYDLSLFEYDAAALWNAAVYLGAFDEVLWARRLRFAGWPEACYACGAPRERPAPDESPVSRVFCPACKAGVHALAESFHLVSRAARALDEAHYAPPIREIHMEDL